LSIGLILLAGCSSTPSSRGLPTDHPQSAHWKERKHPFLFADRESITRAKERIATEAWAKEVFDEIVRKADGILSEPIEIPAQGGQWSHHYVCKECGTHLAFTEGKHLCPHCGKEYSGWPYNEVIAGRKHRSNLAAVETLGWAYALTGEEAYAEYAKALLIQYAEAYTSYPFHDYQGGTLPRGARLLAQTLDESTAIIGTVAGYDLVYASPAWTDADRRKVEDRFFREVAKTIQRNDMGVSNWQSWHNAALSSIGYCLGDEQLVSDAIDGKSGFRFQMKNSVLKDGFWYEGSPSYHFYSLDALRWTALGAQRAGTDLVNIDAFRAMFLAPTRYLFPDFTFPTVNDSDRFPISNFSGLYEIAYAWYGDPVYAMAAAKGKRDSIEALFWGADSLPVEKSGSFWQAVSDSPGVGGAILTQGEPPLSCHIHYGPHGGYHGHPDKLALIVFARGEVIAPDPSRVAYASPLQEGWYKTTLAHNTLVVDRKNQKPAKARSVRFFAADRLSAVQAECPGAYPGVDLIRTTTVTPGYLLDLFIAKSDSPHVYDLPFHFDGELKNALETAPCAPLGDQNGYQYLEEISSASSSSSWSAEFQQSNKSRFRFSLVGTPSSPGYLAWGLTDNPPRRIPRVLASQTGTTARFLSLIEPFENAPSIEKIETEEFEADGKQWIRVTLSGKSETDTIEILKPELPLDKEEKFVTFQRRGR
jgi:hypothetical protein